jgi:hypothetical protein
MRRGKIADPYYSSRAPRRAFAHALNPAAPPCPAVAAITRLETRIAAGRGPREGAGQCRSIPSTGFNSARLTPRAPGAAPFPRLPFTIHWLGLVRRAERKQDEAETGGYLEMPVKIFSAYAQPSKL